MKFIRKKTCARIVNHIQELQVHPQNEKVAGSLEGNGQPIQKQINQEPEISSESQSHNNHCESSDENEPQIEEQVPHEAKFLSETQSEIPEKQASYDLPLLQVKIPHESEISSDKHSEHRVSSALQPAVPCILQVSSQKSISISSKLL